VVLSWEKGKFKPRGDKKTALVALRKLRKRGVKKILAQKDESSEKPQEKVETRSRRKKKGARIRKVSQKGKISRQKTRKTK